VISAKAIDDNHVEASDSQEAPRDRLFDPDARGNVRTCCRMARPRRRLEHVCCCSEIGDEGVGHGMREELLLQ